MRRLVRRTLTLAATGLVAGLAIAVLGAPYGRWNPAALAELYHGTTDTTGTVHVALDCATFTSGTQSSCSYFVPTSNIDLAVTVGNSTGAATTVSYLNFRITNNRQDLLNPATGVDGNLDANPDFNNALAPAGWSCTPPAPSSDEDPSPSVSVSSLSCYEVAAPSNTIPLFAGPDHLTLATVHFNGPGMNGEQTATFTLSDVNIFDETGTEIMSCNPVTTVAGPCFGATVTMVGPSNDYDGDGVPNSTDNCPTHYNPGQTNTDRNFISNAPVYGVDDTTRANSDNQGDACDDDDDNDILLDADEPLGCNDSASLNPLASDSDGDRFLDAAECILGFNPMSSASAPQIVACGAATDVDNDGLSARIELCRYNTDPGVADTDGDGVKDGCEAASLNNDTVVNPADQGLLAAEIMRAVPASSKLVNFDINKDGAFNPADQGLIAARVGKCP